MNEKKKQKKKKERWRWRRRRRRRKKSGLIRARRPRTFRREFGIACS